MKILIVDDSVERSRILVDDLRGEAGTLIGEIDVVEDALSAREALLRNQYDLLVLDVMLPMRRGGDPDESNSLSILVEIAETDNLIKPRHIIGITAYESTEKDVAPAFRSLAWVLVRGDVSSTDWLETIRNAVRYVSSSSGGAQSSQDVANLVVVTALPSEMDAVRRLPWNWGADEPLDDSHFFSRGSFDSKDVRLSVVAVCAARMGMVAASNIVSRAISSFKPSLVAMTGICAGVPGRVNLGDAVCAEMVWDYQSGKYVAEADSLQNFLVDPHFIQADSFVLSRIDQMSQDEDLSVQIWKNWHTRTLHPPKLVKGPIASGSAVLADSRITDRIKIQHRKVCAVEMELYGVFYASLMSKRPRPLVLGLKSVCDFADEHKNDDFQGYSAYTSAQYMKAFCERYAAEL